MGKKRVEVQNRNMKTPYYEVSYSVDGKSWFRMDKHETREIATREALARRNEEIETRVSKVTVERLETFPKLPGKKAPEVVLPGLGRVEVPR